MSGKEIWLAVKEKEKVLEVIYGSTIKISS